MTTPTPAAQKAAQAIAEQLSRTGWNIEDRETLQYAAIIDREMNQWQDIATAPKDGTQIDVYAGYRGRIPDVYWMKGDWCEWGLDSMGCMSTVKIDAVATHWMPKPQIPPLCPATAKP